LKGTTVFSTIAQKVLVGLSGLLLCGFLVVHLAGNLLIYSQAGNYEAYNHYAHAIHASPLLVVAEIVLLVLFLAHIVLTINLVLKNRASRPQGYAVKRSKRGRSRVTAHNVMHWTGFVVLAFILLHLADLRFGLRFPEQPGVEPAERALHVLHDPFSASLYTAGSLLLGYHLYHGFQSAFETIGASSPRAIPTIRFVGAVFATIVALGFASFPVWVNLFSK
jgi:succinate dehydrogenase / fumarate reductase cytochrome b subunit